MTVKTICTLKETESYRLEKVMVSVFSSRAEEMTALILKVDGKEIFLRNFSSYEDIHLKEMIDKIKPEIQKQGYYCLYAGSDWQACYATDTNPLIEFENPLQDVKGDFTSIFQSNATLWKFLGNHSTYSGAFYYVIWDHKLAFEISERLEKIKEAIRTEEHREKLRLKGLEVK